MMTYSAMGKFPNFKLSVVRETREAAEGRAAPRAYVPCDVIEEECIKEPESLQDRVLLGMVKMMKRWQELYKLGLPRFEALEREAAEEVRKEGG
jgi:hypothetical protein